MLDAGGVAPECLVPDAIPSGLSKHAFFFSLDSHQVKSWGRSEAAIGSQRAYGRVRRVMERIISLHYVQYL